ncbi:MAG: inorganic diphosphatase [Actinomycetota bacterium]
MEDLEFTAIIEIPMGSLNKYEIDHNTGELFLDRLLFTATRYPTDYGFAPRTLAEDGDPLDVLVLVEEATFPGCRIRVRPVGLFLMHDEFGRDHKVLCVPATDPRWQRVRDLADLDVHLLKEIAHFFAVYKQLEPGKATEVIGWEHAEAAREMVLDCQRRYRPGSHAGSGTTHGSGQEFIAPSWTPEGG